MGWLYLVSWPLRTALYRINGKYQYAYVMHCCTTLLTGRETWHCRWSTIKHWSYQMSQSCTLHREEKWWYFRIQRCRSFIMFLSSHTTSQQFLHFFFFFSSKSTMAFKINCSDVAQRNMKYDKCFMSSHTTSHAADNPPLWIIAIGLILYFVCSISGHVVIP